MSPQELVYEITDSVLRRHNGLPYLGGWTYPAAYASDEAVTGAAATGGVATAAAPHTMHTSSSESRTAAAATSASSATTSSPIHGASGDTTPARTAAASAASGSGVESAARSNFPASSPRDGKAERDDERGAPWLGWAAAIATLALAGLFLYKGLSVKPVEKTMTQQAPAAPKVEAAAEAQKPELKSEAAPEAVAAAESEAAAPAVAGQTNYYGVSEETGAKPWSAEASMNPDYTVAEATPEEAAPSAEPAAESAATADTPAAAEAPAPAAEPSTAAVEPAAEEAPAPAAEPGATAYYGAAERADAEQAWAAPATMLAEAAEEAPPAVAEDTTGPAPASAPEAEAPPAEIVHGVTALFGTAENPDASQAWAAPAEMNPDYSAEALAPTAAAEAPESAAPAPAGESGATAYYGEVGTSDSTQPWAAPATVYAEPAAAASPAANACLAALTNALTAGTLNFATSSWDILPDSYGTLDKIARLAKGCDGVSIEVGGHTDSTGSPSGNTTLAEFRAKAVVRYLTGAGVEPSKLTAVGYGQDKPVAGNETADGRRQNRRIVFTVK